MNIHKWIETGRVDTLADLVQDATPQCEWPYPQDWIVSEVRHDTTQQLLYISGKYGYSEETFFWSHYWDARRKQKVFCWRYDLTGATYIVGRHETDTEMWNRIENERRALATA